MTAHIYDRLARYFEEGRWLWSIGPRKHLLANITARFPELTGTVSDGTRRVELRVDPTGRYMEALDGWGLVITDIDLRGYVERPASEAVTDLLIKAYGAAPLAAPGPGRYPTGL